MEKIKLEIDSKYSEYIGLIKELILTEEGEEIKDDNKAIEVLLESFVGFLQQQAQAEEGHIHGPDCNHDH